MKRVGLFCLVTAACVLWSQQPPPGTAPPRPPVIPLTDAELQAIPLTSSLSGTSVSKVLFDGKSLTGWHGNPDYWSVSDGAIVGQFNGKNPTSFLFTNESYSDFRLTFSSKMVDSDNHAGVCFWDEIIERPDNKWYTRGPLVIFPHPGMWDYADAKGLRVLKVSAENPAQHDWVKVEVLAQGNRVRTAFNGAQVMEWREADASRVHAGPLGVQFHAWTGAQQVLYKDIVVETFPKQDRLLTVMQAAKR